jgi:aminoglycoside phosphotransferase (APT) family kinase protein
MPLHENEIVVDEALVRSLLTEQCPDWAALPLHPAGAGTENTMYRLGDDLLVRLPRTADKAPALHKELRWLPRLGPLLTTPIPEPVHAGTPTAAYPVAWSVVRWIDGAEPGPHTVRDWPVLGADLAAFVRQLHATDLLGATRTGDLSGYRGGLLRDCTDWVDRAFTDCPDPDLDLPTLRHWWDTALAEPDPPGPHVWLHTDLKPTNLLVHHGLLHAVIDFGALTIGFPDAEHATAWDLPAPARDAYWNALSLDPSTWRRSRAWAIAIAMSGLPYYWHTYPTFIQECQRRLHAILNT